ncbi:MAG: hypothetical protein M3527_04205 [Actinomycetota bacterium]|nr:hypothetical protein [Acidimicrobiia bacterium]MDQ3293637.1 hypothetical protein [Actinomycetota bacterium]
MKRVLALLGAVALVAGALALRSALADDSADVATEPGDEPGAVAAPVVACVPELETVCRGMARIFELRVEEPADTVAAIDSGTEIDAWVTFDPWPEMAGIESNHAFFSDPGLILASSPLVMLVRNGLLDGACADDPNWACAVEARPGRAAVPSPDSAVGRLALGWAAAEWNDVVRPGEPFATAEFELPEFRNWLDDLATDEPDPLDEVLVLGPAGPFVLATTHADVSQRLAGSREDGRLAEFQTSRDASVAVVIVGPAAEFLASEPTLAANFESAGWTPSTEGSSGLPSPGLMFALAQEVSS